MNVHTYPGKGLSLSQLVFALNEELKRTDYSPSYVAKHRLACEVSNNDMYVTGCCFFLPLVSIVGEAPEGNKRQIGAVRNGKQRAYQKVENLRPVTAHRQIDASAKSDGGGTGGAS